MPCGHRVPSAEASVARAVEKAADDCDDYDTDDPDKDTIEVQCLGCMDGAGLRLYQRVCLGPPGCVISGF